MASNINFNTVWSAIFAPISETQSIALDNVLVIVWVVSGMS